MDYNELSQRWNVGVSAIVRVRLRDGTSHEDLGYGQMENSKSRGAGLDKVRVSAVAQLRSRLDFHVDTSALTFFPAHKRPRRKQSPTVSSGLCVSLVHCLAIAPTTSSTSTKSAR